MHTCTARSGTTHRLHIPPNLRRNYILCAGRLGDALIELFRNAMVSHSGWQHYLDVWTFHKYYLLNSKMELVVTCGICLNNPFM